MSSVALTFFAYLGFTVIGGDGGEVDEVGQEQHEEDRDGQAARAPT